MPFEQHSAWKFTKNGDSIDKMAKRYQYLRSIRFGVDWIIGNGGPLALANINVEFTPTSMVF
jgi:hypothetical protein